MQFTFSLSLCAKIGEIQMGVDYIHVIVKRH